MIIAEIGNNHMGDLDSFKDHIRIAKESGADVVKAQAFLSRDVYKFGSMPRSFYAQCEFSLSDYIDMIYWSRAIGIELFYSIFSKSLDSIHFHQKYHKLAGGQVERNQNIVEKKDVDNMIVSIREGVRKPDLRSAQILHVSSYMTKFPGLENISFLSQYYKRRVGYSDHTIGVDSCVEAVEKYGAHVIEKHFTLKKELKFQGIVFRDTVHAADPKELEDMVKKIRGQNNEMLHL